MREAARLRNIYELLHGHYGPRHWWPAESPFEVMVGAILTQNTSWKNVEKAITTLKANDLLDPRRIAGLDVDTLALAIRSSGTFRVKARRLKSFVSWFVTKYDADLERLRRIPVRRLREELLELEGIGRETADSILLYALDLPSFVVDKYTWRVLTRHGLVSEETGYEEMKDLFERHIPPDVPFYNDFHAQIVAVGAEFCRTKARCETCPLKSDLPAPR